MTDMNVMFDGEVGGGGVPGPPQCSPAIDTVLLFMALVQSSILRKQQHTPEPPAYLDREKYDFIVVGAGGAGAVVASRLSARHSVLLLEAGGEEPSETRAPGLHSFLLGSAIDWNFTTQPEPQNCGGRGCTYPRGKALGGSTTINSMMTVRGNPRDYDQWEALGNPGWGWAGVLPFMKRWEDNRDGDFSHDTVHHATGGPQSVQRWPTRDRTSEVFHDAFRELGLPEIVAGDAEHTRGVYFLQFFQRDGCRQSTNRAYLAPVRKARKRMLRVVTGARVTKIIIDPDTKVARGVQYTSERLKGSGKLFSAFATKEVIVSTGAIKTPQLLQLSGIGPKEVLDSVQIPQVVDLPVGLNFQDHMTADILEFRDTKASTPTTPGPWQKAIREYEEKRNGPMATVNVLATFAFLASNLTTEDWPDLQITLSPSEDTAAPCLSRLDEAEERCGGSSRDRSCFATSYAFYTDTMVRVCIMRPRSRGNITLASADPFHQPRIHPNYLASPEDVSILVQGFQMAKHLANTRKLLDNGFQLKSAPLHLCRQYKFFSDEYIRCGLRNYSNTNHHMCCTAKMGPAGDPTAVVDSRLRVHGVKNLRIIDASVMPTIPSSNVGSATIMIGEKGADMVLEDWVKG